MTIDDEGKSATTKVTKNRHCSGYIHMIRFRLAELTADKAFRERRVVPMTEIAQATGIHRATLSKMANQPGSNVGTEIIDKLCRYFACQPGDLMTFIEDHQ